MRKLCTVLCIRKDQSRSWRERTKALMWYYSPTKNKLTYQVRANTYDFWLSGQYGKYNSNIFLFHPLGPFPSKWCVASEFFVLISSHCSTRIWSIRYEGSWSIYFLTITKSRHAVDDSESCATVEWTQLLDSG